MRVAMFLVMMLGTFVLTPVRGSAEPVTAGVAAPSTELSSQAQRPRLRVRPGGRLLYRDCTFRLAQQRRPGGTVIVPVQRCWWVRG